MVGIWGNTYSSYFKLFLKITEIQFLRTDMKVTSLRQIMEGKST